MSLTPEAERQEVGPLERSNPGKLANQPMEASAECYIQEERRREKEAGKERGFVVLDAVWRSGPWRVAGVTYCLL